MLTVVIHLQQLLYGVLASLSGTKLAIQPSNTLHLESSDETRMITDVKYSG